jgi:hypothetical protein
MLNYCSDLIDHYESIRPETTRKFRKLLEKYNYDTIPVFAEYPEYPHVTLMKSIGELKFCAVIDYEGGVTGMDDEIGIIGSAPDFYYEDESGMEDRSWEFHTNIVFTWLATIWQEIKGWEYGIVVKTLENNSVAVFVFNDLACDQLSEYVHYNDKTKRLSSFFKTDLSVLEIYSRVSLEEYPHDLAKSSRYCFRKDNERKEMTVKGNETEEKYLRETQMEPISEIKIHKNPVEARRYVMATTKNWIEEGFREEICTIS